MKVINIVKISVFAKEDLEKVRLKLLELMPFDIEKEKILLKESTATGFDEKEIKIFEVFLDKDRHINAFLENLVGRMNDEVKEWILMQAESRLDEECNFFLRFSKDKLIDENELWLTDQGNCFHIKMNIAAFPKKREKAKKVVEQIFS